MHYTQALEFTTSTQQQKKTMHNKETKLKKPNLHEPKNKTNSIIKYKDALTILFILLTCP
jgi:hypothetical protein